MIGAVTIVAWIIAEAIPFFSDLLSLISSLFISGFSYYFPGLMWFFLLREGGCFSSRKNILLTFANAACILLGSIVLVGGFYASVVDISDQYSSGAVRGSFTCDVLGE